MASEALELAYLTVVDYIIIGMVLALSVGIGVYHGITGNKTPEDFFLANRSLSPVAVACSLTVSVQSSVAILGYPAEVYGYGMQLYWMVPGLMCALLITIHVIIPVFYDLQMKSVNEYIVLRFKSSSLKYMMLIVNSISQMLLLGIILYAPTLAMAAVTPISSDTYILIMGIAVTLYCTTGGMKAVVWTDFFQTIILMLGIILITSSSLSNAGGLINAWHIARENGRLQAVNMSFGLFERHTTVNAFILGMTNYGYIFSFSQGSVQRFTSQRSLRYAKGIMYANLAGTSILLTIIYLAGIGMYAVYHGCDPITLGLIEKKDEVIPFYVKQHLHFLTGVPGLFMACLFSGTMSSISSILNAVPTMLWNDFLAELKCFQNTSEKTKTIFNRLLTVGLGLLMIGLAFLASRTKGIIQVAFVVTSIVAGPVTGVFVMGVAIPIVGKKGAIAGFLVSIIFGSWISIGFQLYGEAAPMLPLDTHLCENSTLTLALNVTTEMPMSPALSPKVSHPLRLLYNISYTYYCLIGLLVCITVGLVTTFSTGCEDLANIKPEHVIHSLRRRVGPADAEISTELESFLPDAPDSKKKLKIKARLNKQRK